MTDEVTVGVVDAIANVALMIAGAGALTFIVLYAGWSAWRSTPVGRAIMRFFLVLAIILVLVEVFEFWNTANELIVDWLAMVFFTGLAVEIWRLVYVLIRTQRRERHERRDNDE